MSSLSQFKTAKGFFIFNKIYNAQTAFAVLHYFYTVRLARFRKLRFFHNVGFPRFHVQLANIYKFTTFRKICAAIISLCVIYLAAEEKEIVKRRLCIRRKIQLRKDTRLYRPCKSRISARHTFLRYATRSHQAPALSGKQAKPLRKA